MDRYAEALARLLGSLAELRDALVKRSEVSEAADAVQSLDALRPRIKARLRQVAAQSGDAPAEELRALRQASRHEAGAPRARLGSVVFRAAAALDKVVAAEFADSDAAGEDAFSRELQHMLNEMLSPIGRFAALWRDRYDASSLPVGGEDPFAASIESEDRLSASSAAPFDFAPTASRRRAPSTHPFSITPPAVGSAPAPTGQEFPRENAAHPGADFIVSYGTNRRPIDPADASKGYSGERDDHVHYGTCKVFVPKSHRIESVGSGRLRRIFDRLPGRQDDRLELRAIEKLEAPAFWRDVQRRLQTSPPDARSALVFVHGYNVSFHDAALRAAQIGFDLSIHGTMAFFSWPSRGRLDGYLADAATIEASEGVIGDFLADFVERSGAETVHVIAHSMGNRGVLRAVNRIEHRVKRGHGARLGQFLLAAADVDAGTFRLLAASYGQLAQRTTLYVSSRDRAVEASRWLHDFDRVGLIPPVTILPGIDTINVTNVDLTTIGHGYVGEARHVLRDMHSLINDNEPPTKRFGVREMHAADGMTYWEIGA
jgi:esterase/lipase superfamily enzyme